MKAYSIVIKDNDISEFGFKNLIESSKQVNNEFEIERFNAITPQTVNETLEKYKLKWNYPWEGSILDPWTGLRKSAYGEKNKLKRIACSLSHFLLWKKCSDIGENILILEHDTKFIHKLDVSKLEVSEFKIIGINDPTNSTFAANIYKDKITNFTKEIDKVPLITSKEIPQGLAGNSAYYIQPEAADYMIDLCYKYGVWPNDAIMCQQLCPWLGVTKTFYTESQNLKSTTSL